jgi:hypothetical protein
VNVAYLLYLWQDAKLAMSSLKFLSKQLVAVVTLSAGLWTGGALPLVAIAQGSVPPLNHAPDRREGGSYRVAEYVPPVDGIPGRREGGGSRGGCFMSQIPVTALMPESAYGETLSDYPSFYFYLPEIPATSARFSLFDEAGDEIYHAEFQVTGESGILAIHLPSTVGLPPLAVGEYYEWAFSVTCSNGDSDDRSGDPYLTGWLKRSEMSPDLAAALAGASGSERASIYAQAGLWYEAIDAAVERRLSQSATPAAIADWSDFLGFVGLSEFADIEFLPGPSEPMSNGLPAQPEPAAPLNP